MSEDTLFKLFYKDESLWKKEYETRFNHKNTVHLSINIGENPAFFCMTTEIYKKLLSIERIDRGVSALCHRLPKAALRQFAERSLVGEIVLTNKVEGVYSTKKDIEDILQNLSKTDKNKRFFGIVSKYYHLMTDEQVPLKSCKDIRKVYDDIFYKEIETEDPGSLPDGQLFRKEAVNVCTATDKIVHRGLMPERKIIEVMESSLNFLNHYETEAIVKIAVFHYLFGYIHPFYDGNGRTSRFISCYLLSKELNKLIGYRISYTIKEHIKEYGKAFEICNDPKNKGDLTPFIEMFLDVIVESEVNLLEALQERCEKLTYFESLIEKLPNSHDTDMTNVYFILIQAALFSSEGISIEMLANEMEKSRSTVTSRLKNIPADLLCKKMNGRRYYYMLNLDAAENYIS